MSLDQSWLGTDITEEMIVGKDRWMCARRNLHGNSLRFFEIAGSILRHAASEYLLITPVFFHSIVGLESALKLHYKKEKSNLRLLLRRAINEGIVQDAVFSNIQPLPNRMVPKEIRGYQIRKDWRRLAVYFSAFRRAQPHVSRNAERPTEFSWLHAPAFLIELDFSTSCHRL